MDMTDSIAPVSDQLDAVDLLTGPRTFTITEVGKGSVEQPVDIHLAEFPRVWRPSKSMRRVLVAAWGPDASAYVGRRVTLYCDDAVMFGKDRVGGTRISHLSDLKGGKRLSVPLLISRGKSAMFTVEPLVEAAPTKPTRKAAESAEPTVAQVAACTDVGALKVMYDAAGSPEMRAQIRARKAELNAPTPAAAPDDGPGPSDADYDAMGARS